MKTKKKAKRLPRRSKRKPSPFTFKKVKHAGTHQDYRIYYGEIHIGNIRAGFRYRAGWDWHARTDINGREILLSGKPGYSRAKLAQDLLNAMRAISRNESFLSNCFLSDTPFMETTKDVGWDEKK